MQLYSNDMPRAYTTAYAKYCLSRHQIPLTTFLQCSALVFKQTNDVSVSSDLLSFFALVLITPLKMAHFLRGKQAGVQGDLSTGIAPDFFVLDDVWAFEDAVITCP